MQAEEEVEMNDKIKKTTEAVVAEIAGIQGDIGIAKSALMDINSTSEKICENFDKMLSISLSKFQI